MKSKKVKGALIATVATVAGVFGGLKLYASKKNDVKKPQPNNEVKQEEEDL